MFNIKIIGKSLFILVLIFTLFLGLGMVSANHVDIDETVSISDDNLQTSSNDYNHDVIEETNKKDNENFRYSTSIANMDKSSGEVVKDSNSVLNFSSLNETINSNSSSEIKLDNDYLYDDTTDSRFISLGGIVINRNLTIDGQGHTIDLAGKTRFLYNYRYYITLKNVIIKNGYANYGGAIYSYGDSGNYVGCINTTFINNNVNEEGGAVCILNAGRGNFINCTIINNSAKSQSGAVAINFATGIFIDSIFEILF